MRNSGCERNKAKCDPGDIMIKMDAFDYRNITVLGYMENNTIVNTTEDGRLVGFLREGRVSAESILEKEFVTGKVGVWFYRVLYLGFDLVHLMAIAGLPLGSGEKGLATGLIFFTLKMACRYAICFGCSVMVWFPLLCLFLLVCAHIVKTLERLNQYRY